LALDGVGRAALCQAGHEVSHLVGREKRSFPMVAQLHRHKNLAQRVTTGTLKSKHQLAQHPGETFRLGALVAPDAF
jgi:hypothetical protein